MLKMNLFVPKSAAAGFEKILLIQSGFSVVLRLAIGWRRGFILRLLAIADESRADDDEHHANPAHARDAFVQEPDRGKGGEHKTQSRQRPEETDVAPGHQNEQAAEKQRLKKHAEQDLRIGGAGLANAEDFGGGDAVHVADVRHALFQQHDTGGFKGEADQQNQKQFYHIFEPQMNTD